MRYLAAILVLFFVTACGQPSRPDSVSDNGVWVGGTDGGAWIEVTEVQHGKFYAIISHDNGDRWTSGWFIFSPPPKEPNYQPKNVNAEYIKKYANYFSGSEISITDFASGRVFVYQLQK